MEGFLLKWVNYIYGWKKRYFVLHDGVLHYCQDKGQSRKGAVHLNVAEISSHPKNPCRLIIDTGCTVIHLKAETRTEAQSWILALKTAKEALAGEQCFREQRGLSNGVENEPVESPEINSVLLKLAGLQANLEERLDQLPAKYQDDPVFTDVIKVAREFKVRVM